MKSPVVVGVGGSGLGLVSGSSCTLRLGQHELLKRHRHILDGRQMYITVLAHP